MPESRLLSRRDLDFLLYEWLDVESLTKRERYADHSRETFDSVLDLSAEIATEKFAPCKVVLVPEIGQAMAAYFDAGLQGRPVTGRTLRATRRISEHPDVRRMLAVQKSYVEGGQALVLYCARLVDETRSALESVDRQSAAALLDLLTPIAKSWPSQYCLTANDLAIQIHGGYGYTRDYPVEQFYRDNRLNPIHEGTHGVQALDLLGRKVLAGGGASLQLADNEEYRAYLRRSPDAIGRYGDHVVALDAFPAGPEFADVNPLREGDTRRYIWWTFDRLEDLRPLLRR